MMSSSTNRKRCLKKRVAINTELNTYHSADRQIFDPDTVFYTLEEYGEIKDECCDVLRRFASQRNGAEDCLRGLETKVPLAWRRTLNIRRTALYTVLDEQRRQLDDRDEDPEKLALVYEGYAKPCVIRAQKMALRDATIALKIYKDHSRKNSTSKDSTRGVDLEDFKDKEKGGIEHDRWKPAKKPSYKRVFRNLSLRTKNSNTRV